MVREWFLSPVKRWIARSIRIHMSVLTDIANKVAADIDTKLAAHRTELDAKDATIKDLNDQLNKIQSDVADMSAAIATLQAADAKLA